MTSGPLALTREQVLAYRRRAGALDVRLPVGPDSLRRAAWAGLQDSMPRAALLSIHARVEDTQPDAWEDPSLVQLWGPRYNAYVVSGPDHAVFSLGRLPEVGSRRKIGDELADRLESVLEGRRLPYGEVGRLLGKHARSLAYAAPTGRVLIRWDGARNPTVWTVPRPNLDPAEARLELARRYLHVFGPVTPESFAKWAGIRPPGGKATFNVLHAELTPVQTPIGEGWILAADEPMVRSDPSPVAPARLLPSGDAYYLLWDTDRELLVPDPDLRAKLWTSRVWPGALLVGGEVAGTWRRANASLTVNPWRTLSAAERHAVEAEAAGLPLPGVAAPVSVRWELA
ncbi:winged helix DNA-binding domain-containing protein [soil metagenome]